jgi:hypothetical protein
MTSTNKPQPPAWLLHLAITDDTHEEDAIDFLDDHRIPYASHNRSFLIALAYQNGWRPKL